MVRILPNSRYRSLEKAQKKKNSRLPDESTLFYGSLSSSVFHSHVNWGAAITNIGYHFRLVPVHV